MDSNMNWLSLIALVCLWFATCQIEGQLYFGNIGGLSGWFGKASDRYLGRILAGQCASKQCSPYQSLNKELSQREHEGELSQNFNNQRGNKRVNWSKSVHPMTRPEPWDNKKGNHGQSDDNKDSKLNWKWKVKPTIVPGIDAVSDPTTTEATKNTSSTSTVMPPKDSNVTKSVHNRTSTEGGSAPLVQVYVVASGSGGAHTNIGHGGYYGKNNGHTFRAEKDRQDLHSWADFGNENIQRKGDQEWANDQKTAWSVNDDSNDGSETYQQEDSYSPFMDDTLSESSSKYQFGYHDIEIKPESLAARTRRRMLRNWHKDDLVNGYWRFWFKR